MTRDSGMLRRLSIQFIATAFFLTLAGAAAMAQSESASIVGIVVDESGAILPGVTVTASSPSLQITAVSDVSNERGEYRLAPLPIGTYKVEYALSGFQGVRREDIRLTVGFVAKLDIVMKVGSMEETITVSGVSPLVDVNSTGTSRTTATPLRAMITSSPRSAAWSSSDRWVLASATLTCMPGS